MTESAEPSLAQVTPGETPRGPVRVETPQATVGPGLGHEGLAQAKAAYKAAEAYAKNNPQDAAGAAKQAPAGAQMTSSRFDPAMGKVCSGPGGRRLTS